MTEVSNSMRQLHAHDCDELDENGYSEIEVNVERNRGVNVACININFAGIC